MASSAAYSSSFAAATSPKKYDVFISFRGEDTRTNFTSHLLAALCQKSIKTYIDYELRKGDEISPALLKAIEDCKVSLVVFSENYTSSKWCLDELVKILECRKHQAQIVIPIFYKVDPSHVRKQTEKQAFIKQDRNSMKNQDKIQKWEAALTEAANLVGWDSRIYRDESILIENIVSDVLQKLDYRYPSDLKDLVGVDENSKCIELLLEKVKIVGIWGMAGIGKTTIAKVVFAKLFHQYEGCCFLENVREESQKHGLNYLHDKLLYEIFNEENPCNNNSFKLVQSTSLKRRLDHKKIFIVFDDVNNFDQLEYLARECDCLATGSRVIITTRDKHLLNGRVDAIHEVKELNFQDSLKLLSLNAFKERDPKMGFEELCKRAVVYARGIPLVLKVLGSLFLSKSIETCESALQKLKKYPNVQIQSMLKLSYDDLDDLEKDIFLDIAFFFKGEDKNHVTRILDACDFYATSGIETLLDRALITITKDSKIQMHDLIQEIGWEIVRQESVKHLGRRSRLRDTKEVYDMLKHNKGTDVVEGIILNVSEIKDLHLTADTFKKMTNLRILKFYSLWWDKRSTNVHLPKGLESFSNKLRYLQWNGYPLKSLPSTFCTEKLVEIILPFSHVKKLWDGVQELVSLKEIDLSGSLQLMELPDFSMASKLERVNLTHCEGLRQVHPSLSSLHTLVDLVLYRCNKVISLHLRSVKYLVVNGCTSLKEFSLISEEISVLDLRGTSIENLPSSIGNLSKLEKLSIGQSLKKVPNNLSPLRSLKELNLLNCRELDTSNLHTLLDASPSLQKLNLQECSNLSQVPNNIKHLLGLEYLSIRDCKRLWFLPELPPSIQHLNAINCTSLETALALTASESPPGGKGIQISFENCIKLDEHSRYGIMEYAQITSKQAACANANVPHYLHKSCSVCLPGSKVPEWFKITTTETSITMELAALSHLLGFVFCVVLSEYYSNDKFEYHRMVCEWYLEDGKRVGYSRTWYNKAISTLNSDHVYLWYESSCNSLLEAVKERAAIHNYPKVSFKFHVETSKLGEPKQFQLIGIKECGIYPICASDYCNFINKMELDFGLELKLIRMGAGSSYQNRCEKEMNSKDFIFPLPTKTWRNGTQGLKDILSL